MPGDRSYGDILRREREKKGYDLTSMSRKLHIRPDILQAIENADFDKMPARGYSKNMVRAYAKSLGLDEKSITGMFLDEVHLHEVGAPRGGGARRPQGRSQASRGRAQDRQPSRDLPPSSYRSGRKMQSARPGRDLDSQPISGNRSASRPLQREGSQQRGQRGQRQGQGRPQEQKKPGIGTRAIGGIGSIVSSIGSGRGRSESKVPRSFSTIGSTPPYAQNNAGVQRNSFASMNLPMLLSLVAAIIVLIIVVVVVSNGSRQANEDVPNIPISGLTDTSSPEDEEQLPTQSEAAPSSAKVQLLIADGQKSWIEVYENGSNTPRIAEVMNGPATEDFDVTGTLTIKTPNPSAVTLKVDNKDVTLVADSSGNYVYTVDFNAILNAWKDAHGFGSSDSSAASSSSSDASSSSSSASSSSSSKRSDSSSGSSSSSRASSSSSSSASNSSSRSSRA